MEGYSNSYQNSTSARETEFQRLAQNIGTNIQKIQQNGKFSSKCHILILIKKNVPSTVSSMQRMITQIGSPQDNTQLQNQL